MIQAVVFDFDGVILESGELKGEAFLELFSEYREHHEALFEHHLEHLGISRYKKFEWFYRNCLGREIEPQESRELGQRYNRIVIDRMAECPFVPGALQCLETLSPLRPLFVASGTPQPELEQIVAARGIGAHFRKVWGSPHEKAPAIAEASRIAGCVLAETVMIGDGLSDYRAATAAECQFIGRRTDYQGDRFCDLDVRMIDDLTELAPLVLAAAEARS